MSMDASRFADHDIRQNAPWNKGKLTGAKPPLQPEHVWAIRTRSTPPRHLEGAKSRHSCKSKGEAQVATLRGSLDDTVLAYKITAAHAERLQATSANQKSPLS
jgi:hypothetical protein